MKNEMTVYKERIIEIGKQMKELRMRCGMTQEDAAAALGITRVTYSRYELGIRVVGIERVPDLIALFRCRYEDIFGEIVKENRSRRRLKVHDWVSVLTK